MRDVSCEALSLDAVHGYIPFVSRAPAGSSETTERDLIDHAWLQRLRQIHQLQTAWWVFPTATHTRFQHVLGAMHLASRAAAMLYDSLAASCPDVPSRGYVSALLRCAALLHDVGHGPFGHFFDTHFLSQWNLTHEHLGSRIVQGDLTPLLRGIRRTPAETLDSSETLDPAHVAALFVRPAGGDAVGPRWLHLLQSLFCGIYTVDNLDFVLRDAYMSGFNQRAVDIERLLHYSAFTPEGLAIHARGLGELVRFIGVRAELFRTIYFHRTVRAIDLTLAELFADSRDWLFPGCPLDHLPAYQAFTDWSLLVDVRRWADSDAPPRRALGQRWRALLAREVPWKMACERVLFVEAQSAQQASLLQNEALLELALRAELPAAIRHLPLRIDLPRHVHRPGTRGAAAGRNFVYDPEKDEVRPLDSQELFRRIPFSFRLCRIYVQEMQHAQSIARAVDSLLHAEGGDEATNM